MNERIKTAFDSVHADEELKSRVKAAVMRRSRRGVFMPRLLVPAVCALVVILGVVGVNVYFEPVSIISVDVNPSIELSVNRFGRVTAVEGRNDDGIRLAAGIDVKFMSYTEAIENILQSDEIAEYTAQGEEVHIAVVSLNGESGGEMFRAIEQCAGSGVYCHTAEYSEVEAAHGCGLSYGKYRAYLEAKQSDPSLTPDDVKGLTMREIRDLGCHDGAGNSSGVGNSANGNSANGNSGHHGGNSANGNVNSSGDNTSSESPVTSGNHNGNHHGNGWHGGHN